MSYFDFFFLTNDLWKKYNQLFVFFINKVKFKISLNFEYLLVKNYNINSHRSLGFQEKFGPT